MKKLSLILLFFLLKCIPIYAYERTKAECDSIEMKAKYDVSELKLLPKDFHSKAIDYANTYRWIFGSLKEQVRKSSKPHHFLLEQTGIKGWKKCKEGFSRHSGPYVGSSSYDFCYPNAAQEMKSMSPEYHYQNHQDPLEELHVEQEFPKMWGSKSRIKVKQYIVINDKKLKFTDEIDQETVELDETPSVVQYLFSHGYSLGKNFNQVYIQEKLRELGCPINGQIVKLITGPEPKEESSTCSRKNTDQNSSLLDFITNVQDCAENLSKQEVGKVKSELHELIKKGPFKKILDILPHYKNLILEVAIENESTSVLRKLLKHGIELNGTTSTGQSLFELASTSPRYEIKEIAQIYDHTLNVIGKNMLSLREARTNAIKACGLMERDFIDMIVDTPKAVSVGYTAKTCSFKDNICRCYRQEMLKNRL